MGIASLTPSVLRLPSLSMVLVPVHALVAFIMPLATGRVHSRHQLALCPQHFTSAQSRRVEGIAACKTDSVKTHPLSRLKVIREYEPGSGRSQTGRMVISGRMADVCAELDRIAQKESIRR